MELCPLKMCKISQGKKDITAERNGKASNYQKLHTVFIARETGRYKEDMSPDQSLPALSGYKILARLYNYVHVDADYIFKLK